MLNMDHHGVERAGTRGRVPFVLGLLGALALGTPILAQESAATAGPQAVQAPSAVVDQAELGGLSYRSVGPSRGGRVTAVAGHRSHPHTFYMGSTGGGIWKTTDRGHNWVNISDEYLDVSPAVGAIRVAPSDPDIIYVGMGSDGIRSNIIRGNGMYKSEDAGESWRHIGLDNAGQIGRMVVHPDNPDIVWVGAVGNPFGPNPERGLYKTTDGGDTWRATLQIADSVGVYGVVMEPGNPDVLYATTWRAERKPWSIISGMQASGGGGIYKSTDGGESWDKLTNGLPSGLIGKIDLTISDAAPQRVYALVEAPDEERGVYRSDDGGQSWRQMSNQQSLISRPFYFTNIHVDPQNPDQLYIGNVRYFRSRDGGATWEMRPSTHADNHDLWINPDNPMIQVQGNDGGASVTLDGGDTWSTINNQPTSELYQVDVDSRFPYWLYAGQQDNTTIAVPSLPPSEADLSGHQSWWREIGGCETGPAVPRPNVEPLVVYSNCKGRFGRYSELTGQEQQFYVGVVSLYGVNPKDLPYRFQRTVPIEVSPFDPNLVFHGSQFVHRTTNGGRTWETISPDLTAFLPERQVISGAPINRDITGEEHYSTLYSIATSPHSRDEIWAGANDGPVHVTLDGGDNWANVTPPMPAEGRVNDIFVSPHQAGKAYVAAYRYLLDDWEPYLFKTEDYGETWTRLTPGDNGVASDNPTRVIAEDPDREGLLYLGTERGMFVSFDDGATWAPFQLDLPVTPITGIQVYRKDLVLSTMGRGFYILDNLTPLHQYDATVETADAHLFEPRDAYRMRYRAGGDAPAAPEFPEPGAMIDYWVGTGTGDISLEIVDGTGQTVQTFRSNASGNDALPAEPGLNRFTWDLRYPGPNGSGRGPMAVPGTYTVRLHAPSGTQEAALDVLIDPRVEMDGITMADLQLQFDHNIRVRDLIADGENALETVEMLEQRNNSEEIEERIAAVKGVLLPPEDITVYPPPMLVDQIDYLYGATMRADQPPGDDALNRYQELRAQMDEVQATLQQLTRLVSER